MEFRPSSRFWFRLRRRILGMLSLFCGSQWVFLSMLTSGCCFRCISCWFLTTRSLTLLSLSWRLVMRFFVGTLLLTSKLGIELNSWFLFHFTRVGTNWAFQPTFYIRLIWEETLTRVDRWWSCYFLVWLVRLLFQDWIIAHLGILILVGILISLFCRVSHDLWLLIFLFLDWFSFWQKVSMMTSGGFWIDV